LSRLPHEQHVSRDGRPGLDQEASEKYIPSNPQLPVYLKAINDIRPYFEDFKNTYGRFF